MVKSVCIIVQNYYDIDPRVRRKAEALSTAGYEVDVIALPMQNNLKKNYTLNNVRIHTLPMKKKRGGFARYIFEYLGFLILATFKVASLMNEKKYRVIDINTLPDFLVFSGLVPKLRGAKIILDMHEVMPEFYMSKYNVDSDHWIIRLIRFQERLSIKFADYVMTINEPIQKLLEARGLNAQKVTIMMNSADESLFNPDMALNEDSKKDKFVMMYHGTLTFIYGLDIALNAFNKVHNEMLNAEFWIVGDGPERDTLEKLVENNGLTQKVKFIGMIPQQDIPQWLNRCDVGVLATRQDAFLELSFSNKLPEYIIMGKPVIVSRLRAIRHYFTEQALSFFEPQNINDLSRKMLDLYLDKERRKSLSDQAQEEYRKINWDVMKQRYLNLIDSM